MSSITFSGLASGLDTKAIIQALLAVERRPIFLLESRKKNFKSQKDLFGTLETKLQELRDKADDIRKTSDFLAFKTELDREDYMSASAGTGAQPGTYAIDVRDLATAQVSSTTTRALANKDVDIFGSGTLTFTVGGNDFNVDLTEEFNSLQDVASAINSTDGLDVTASVLETSTGNFKLVVSSSETGAAGAFTVTGSNGMSTVASELTANTDAAASDAVFRINGIEVTRSSNTVSDVIAGVTLTLKKDGGGTYPGEPTTLTVSPDGGKTAEKVEDFVKSYNDIVDFVEAQFQVDDEGQTSAALFGDSTLRSIRSSLRSIVGSSVSTGNQSYELLSQVGITTETDGKLKLDKAVLEAAVADDETAVKNLFADATNGIAGRIHSQAEGYLDTVDGILATRKQGIDSRIKQIDDNIARAERRLEQMEASLTQRFANLEILMSRLQGQGSALTSIGNLTNNIANR